jgi:prevent-host-death family protein
MLAYVCSGLNMRERGVGIYELKSKLSQCIREVKQGATIVVTERGRPVARLVPNVDSFTERLAILRKNGAVLWSGRRLAKAKPAARTRGKQTLADIVVEDRR